MSKKPIHSLNLLKGLTTPEIVSIAVICCGFFVLIGKWFSSHTEKSKIAETKTVLSQIFDAEVTYYNNSQPQTPAPTSKTPRSPANRKIFLPLSPQPPFPTNKPQYGNFTQGDWALLGIKYNKPVYFSYSVETSGVGTDATFSVIARGDLDGNGHFSHYEMVGHVNPNEQIMGKDMIYALDPSE